MTPAWMFLFFAPCTFSSLFHCMLFQYTKLFWQHYPEYQVFEYLKTSFCENIFFKKQKKTKNQEAPPRFVRSLFLVAKLENCEGSKDLQKNLTKHKKHKTKQTKNKSNQTNNNNKGKKTEKNGISKFGKLGNDHENLTCFLGCVKGWWPLGLVARLTASCLQDGFAFSCLGVTTYFLAGGCFPGPWHGSSRRLSAACGNVILHVPTTLVY